MSTPSRSVWSGRPSRPQSGARAAAGSSAMPNIPTNTTQPVADNTPDMPNIPAASAQTTTPIPPTAPASPASVPPAPAPTPAKEPVHIPSGDIILPSSSDSNAKNNKTPILIGAIIAAGVTIIAVLIISMTGVFRNSSPSAATDAKGKFNVYANYLLFGKESADEIPDYNQETAYTFDDVFSQIKNPYDDSETTETVDTEGNLQYINKLKAFFDDFYSTYNTEASDTEDVDEYKESVDLIHAYVNFTPPSDEEILSNSDGSDFKKFYQVFYDLGSEAGKNYGDYGVKSAEAIVNLAKIYEEAGCDFNQETEAALTCLENADISEESVTKLDEIDATLLEAESEMTTIVEDSADSLIDQCWSVKDGIL